MGELGLCLGLVNNRGVRGKRVYVFYTIVWQANELDCDLSIELQVKRRKNVAGTSASYRSQEKVAIRQFLSDSMSVHVTFAKVGLSQSHGSRCHLLLRKLRATHYKCAFWK